MYGHEDTISETHDEGCERLKGRGDILGVDDGEFQRIMIEHIAAEQQLERARACKQPPYRFEMASQGVGEANSVAVRVVEDDDLEWDVISIGTADTLADELREWEEVG